MDKTPAILPFFSGGFLYFLVFFPGQESLVWKFQDFFKNSRLTITIASCYDKNNT